MATAPQRQSKTVSEVRNAAVNFVGKLDVGELLTGTPTVTEVGSADLSIASITVSIIALTILGESVAIGQAVQFRVSGGVAGIEYTVRVTAVTDATPSQTVIVNLSLKVEAD